jgi:hypothetical protein
MEAKAENSCNFTDLWYNKQKYAVPSGVAMYLGGKPYG